VVLDRRLPAWLNQISDKAEGSISDPLKPDQDLIGTISSNNGNVDIVVERGTAASPDLSGCFPARRSSPFPTCTRR
jgi:hypothetical protein